MLSFGFRIPEWRRVPWYESPAVGRLPMNHDKWDPREWTPRISNGAFNHMRADDAFWAAEKLTYITDPMIDAAVREGQFGDEEASRQLARVIRERRNRILQMYLPAINPITRPTIENGQLRFHNAAVEAGVAKPPSGYRADVLHVRQRHRYGEASDGGRCDWRWGRRGQGRCLGPRPVFPCRRKWNQSSSRRRSAPRAARLNGQSRSACISAATVRTGVSLASNGCRR